MSSLIYSMIMGTPTNNRRPLAAASWLCAATLGIGAVLSFPQYAFAQVPGALLMGAASVWLWLRHHGLQSEVMRLAGAERFWQATMNGSQDAITVLQPRQDMLGRFQGYDITQANARSHTLFGSPANSLPGQALFDLLPADHYASLHHRLLVASHTQQPQLDEHVLHQADAEGHIRWLHHQIIPLAQGIVLISRDTTEVHQSIQAVREQEAFYRTLVDSLPMAVFARSTRPSTAGEYVVWNRAAADVTQLSAEQVLGRKANDLLPAEVTKRGDEQDLCVLREPRIHHFPNLIYATPRGERIVDMIKTPVYGVDGEVDHILAIAHDVTAQRQAAEQLKMASRVIEETGDAVVVSDAVDRVVMVNPAFLNLTGMSPSEVVGHSAELLGLPPLRESHLPGVDQALRAGHRWSGESHQVCQDGSTVETWLSVSTLRNDLQKITQHIRVFSDISVLKAHQRELVEQARHDSLTGLPNRRAFNERLNQAMARARRNPQALAVLFLDLDGFKAVNDRYGHAAGDALLIEVAKRLLQCVRLTDCVCRLAGDEFTVILEGAGHTGEVVRICERILERLCQPHAFGEDAVIVSPSIGAAMYELGETHEAMCQRADAAMYAAKHAGKARYVLSPQLAAHAASATTAPLQMLKQGLIG